MTAYDIGRSLGTVVIIVGILTLIYLLHKAWHALARSWREGMAQAQKDREVKLANKARMAAETRMIEKQFQKPEPYWWSLDDEDLTEEQRQFRRAHRTEE